ncbi:MAG TPA: quinone oxidoreductase [Kofleriaceae bacterium]|jgi:NADPH2:quinone reductase|nr:quinone oxidoreductase [Kofleriaceae bacterium]
MRAIQIDRFGGAEEMHLADVPVGDPGPGEVRVRHRACGINFIDIYHRTGLYPNQLPLVLGTEGAGIVEAVGAGVTHLAVGDRVAYAARTPGSYAEARVVPATPVVKLPDAIDFDTGAAMMLKGLTVQYLLRRTRVELAPGEPILWHAAAGGVGLIACQWAKALGLRLIGTAGSDEKCKLAEQHGAAYTINYRREDVVARVREITGGKGVNVVYDPVGKDTWERSLDCLAPLGVLVAFGNASGPIPPVNLGVLSLKGSLYVQRPTLGTYTATRESAQAMADELFAIVASGKVKIPVERRYPLAEAAQAHRDLEGRGTTGAGVLVP